MRYLYCWSLALHWPFFRTFFSLAWSEYSPPMPPLPLAFHFHWLFYVYHCWQYVLSAIDGIYSLSTTDAFSLPITATIAFFTIVIDIVLLSLPISSTNTFLSPRQQVQVSLHLRSSSSKQNDPISIIIPLDKFFRSWLFTISTSSFLGWWRWVLCLFFVHWKQSWRELGILPAPPTTSNYLLYTQHQHQHEPTDIMDKFDRIAFSGKLICYLTLNHVPLIQCPPCPTMKQRSLFSRPRYSWDPRKKKGIPSLASFRLSLLFFLFLSLSIPSLFSFTHPSLHSSAKPPFPSPYYDSHIPHTPLTRQSCSPTVILTLSLCDT